MFGSNTEITSFKELELFTGLNRLDAGMFSNCVNLGSVKFPKSIVTVYGEAMFNCSKCTFVLDLPNLINMVGNNSFRNSGIAEIMNLGKVTKIGDSFVFANCAKLTKAVLPETLEKIPNYTFQNCSALSEINLPKSITSIGDYAFHSVPANNKLDLPNLTNVGSNAFVNTGFVGVNDLGSVISLPMRAFAGSSISYFNSLEDITSLGNGAFANCANFTQDINLPNLTNIGDQVFMGSGTVRVLNLGTTITELKYYTFLDCPNLEYIELPSTITKIGDWAVGRCYKLTVCILHSNEPPQIASTTFSGSLSCIFYVPDAAVSNYKAATNWSEYASRIKGISELP